MKGFNLKKLLPRKALGLMGLGAVVWAIVLVWVGPPAALASLWKGIQAFGIVMALSATAAAFRAASWRMAIVSSGGTGRRNAPLVSVLLASLAVGGTPIRLAVLKKRTGIPDGADSVVIDGAVRALAAIVFVLFGLFFGFLFLPGDGSVRGLMLIAAVAGFGYVVIKGRGREGFFTSLLNGLPRRLVSPALRGRLGERDRFLSRFRDEKSATFYMMAMIHLAVWFLFTLEILAVGRAIDAYFPSALALALAAVIPVARMIFGFVPASLGLLEAAVVLVLALTFGKPLAPLGLALLLVLRLRTFVWWGVGWGAAGNPLKLLFGK